MYRLGVDVGGTFTDLVIQDAVSGLIRTVKVPSTPHDPSEAVLDAIRRAADPAGPGIDLATVSQLIHSTTVASNTILQGAGARTGLLVTEGFRDLLEIRRHKRYVLFDATYRKLAPLVERRLSIGIPERVDAQGQVVTPLDEQAVREAMRFFAEEGVEAVAIYFLFSFLNDDHERRAAEIAHAMLPSAFVSISSAIYPQYREYERASTTVVNSYLGRPRIALHRPPVGRGARPRRPGAASAHAVERRRDRGTRGEPASLPDRRIRARRRRDRGGVFRRAGRTQRTSSPSTWAAPPPRPG